MSACEQNPKEKAAVLTLKLRADSGYEADAEYRISAEQWGEVLGICEGTRQAPAEMSPDFTDTARAALLWVLWHHQGGSSPVGQPIRLVLGMDAHERLSETQVQEAKQWAALTKAETRDFHRGRAEPVNAQLIAALRKAHMALIGYLPGHRNAITDAAIECACAAIAAAEAQQAGPVQLTDEEIIGIRQVLAGWDCNTPWSQTIALSRAIETAVLERNGLKPQAKTYGPNNPARLRRPDESVDAYREAMGWPTNDQPQAKGD